jgi:hypothetical protein
MFEADIKTDRIMEEVVEAKPSDKKKTKISTFKTAKISNLK